MARFGTQARQRWRDRALAPLAMLLGLWAAELSAAPMPAGSLPDARGAVAPAQFYGPRFGIFIRPPLYRSPIRPEYEEVEEEYAPPPRPRPVIRYRPLPAKPVVRTLPLRPRSVAAAPVRAGRKTVRRAPGKTTVAERPQPKARTRPAERASATIAARPRTVARVERFDPPPPRREEPVRVERVRPPPREEVFVPRGESTGGGNFVPRRFDRGPQLGNLGPRGDVTGNAQARPPSAAPPPRGDITGGGSVGPGRSFQGPRFGSFRPRGESAGTGPSRPTIAAPPRGGADQPPFRRTRPFGGF